MEVKPKVVAAITTALQCYLQLERQLAAASLSEQKTTQEVPCPAFSPWVISGRQASMEMRRYWQMRLVR